MTFIASVVARDGIALIADSLVTTSTEVTSMTADDFFGYLKDKKNELGSDDFRLSPDDFLHLFKKVKTPIGSRDYAEKMFKYDKNTAITTAGNAKINGKWLKQVIDESIQKNRSISNYGSMTIEDKLTSLCNFLSKEADEHLKDNNLGHTSFIVSHLDKRVKKGKIYKINIRSTTKEARAKKPEQQIVVWEDSPFKIVCDGQDKISNALLFGTISTDYVQLMLKTLEKIFQIMELNDETRQKEIRDKLLEDRGVFLDIVVRNFEILKIRELSLQEAVDLACLLMAIVRDFQKYTENMSTVGGQIKIAVIDNQRGFRFINGHDLIPKII